MNLQKRSDALELLDADTIPSADLFQNLRELRFINTYLGGHRVVLEGIRAFICADSPLQSALEIGSGGGDNLGAIQQKYPQLFLQGVDMKPDCTNFAQSQFPDIEFITSDYRTAPLSHQPDVIFNSLFCHHFNNEQLVEMLRLMKSRSRKGFFIADLHRHWLAYYSIKLLTWLFSKSYLVKNDAPLSVLRGFKRTEWEQLLAKAGIEHYEIRWLWAFRYLIVVKHEKS